MARKNRVKRPYAIYHIIMRGMSDLMLFRNNADKRAFLKILNKYKRIYRFRVYEYCILNTHVHLMINSNGADISDFMKIINQCYATYYNKKYKRRGPVLGNRYYSRIPLNNYDFLNVAAYIHNNAKDVKGFKEKVEDYEFSSFGIYIGKYKDTFKLIDSELILGFFAEDLILARLRFKKFVKSKHSQEIKEPTFNISELKDKNLVSKFRNVRISITRKIDAIKIINFICENLQIKKDILYDKYNRQGSEYRSFYVLMLKVFSNLSYSEVSKIISHYAISSISFLFTKGYYLVENNSKYKDLILKFIKENSNFDTQSQSFTY